MLSPPFFLPLHLPYSTPKTTFTPQLKCIILCDTNSSNQLTMNKLSATCIGHYISQKGNKTFRYKVTGTPESLQAYQDAQGEYYRVDEETGNVLWFTTRYAGERCALVVNSNGKIYADMTEFNKIASLTEQFGGVLGQEIARQAVSRLMGGASVSAGEQVKETV